MASFVGTDASDSAYYGSITNCFTTGSVTGSSPFQYAFAEQLSATKRSEITNCYFAVENLGIKNQNESATEKPQEEMKTEDFAAALNNGDNSNGWSFVNGQVLCGAEPADYSAVETAMAAIPTDLTVYTDESVAALNTAVDGVVRGKAFVSQANVDTMAQAIEDAIAALQYKDADYTKVDEAIAKANALNKDNYKDFSAVEAAVNAVVRDKNITEQDEVDAMAKAIEDAMAALVKKPTEAPTEAPTAAPSTSPTEAPTETPTATPTAAPSASPTSVPTATPTATPTAAPSASPTAAPTATPTVKPTATPSARPTAVPTATPTVKPTATPTPAPKADPNNPKTGSSNLPVVFGSAALVLSGGALAAVLIYKKKRHEK